MPIKAFLPLVMGITLLSLSSPTVIQADEVKRPKLAVILVFDQMRADYLERWQHLFVDGGFRRLCQEGAWFKHCNYPYAMTKTAVGHASIGTGCTPDVHGIVNNDWWDPKVQRGVYAVESDRWKTRVWSDVAATEDRKGPSPDRLLVPGFGDMLQDKYGEDCKVVSLSLKDRSAILLGGKHPDACYWVDTKTGMFATSNYYGDVIHDWVRKFNDSRPADRWFGKSWDRLRDDVDYVKEAGPDDVVGEGEGVGQGRTFPHPFASNGKTPDAKYYESVGVSPMANEILMELAIQAIEAEKLGQRDTPDMLCVSFSSNDLIGHMWGPDSQEVLDVTLRSDLLVKSLLDELDRTVGKGNYVVMVSADHGVCPIPEILEARGVKAGRIGSKQLIKDANAFLDGEYKVKAPAKWVADEVDSWLAFNQATLAEHGVSVEDASARLAVWLEKQPGIQRAITKTDLLRKDVESDPIRQKLLLSFLPDRTGDIAIINKPHYISSSYLNGTTHGTPYEYDTHVPGLFYGAGIVPGVRDDQITPQSFVPTLCELFDIKAPTRLYTHVPEHLVKRASVAKSAAAIAR